MFQPFAFLPGGSFHWVTGWSPLLIPPRYKWSIHGYSTCKCFIIMCPKHFLFAVESMVSPSRQEAQDFVGKVFFEKEVWRSVWRGTWLSSVSSHRKDQDQKRTMTTRKTSEGSQCEPKVQQPWIIQAEIMNIYPILSNYFKHIYIYTIWISDIEVQNNPVILTTGIIDSSGEKVGQQHRQRIWLGKQ